MNQTATQTQEAYVEDIIDFISTRLGIDKHKLSAETLVEEDIYIAGLDTLAFYDAFFVHFQVKNPGDFDARKYVTSDVPSYLGIMKQIINPKKYGTAPTRNVTIAHLAKCAMLRTWIDS